MIEYIVREAWAEIATVITDLYSANFRSNLIQWIQSIPFYPKPFDFVFEPITKLLKHMVDDMIDADLYDTCLIKKEPFHVLQRTQAVQETVNNIDYVRAVFIYCMFASGFNREQFHKW